MSFKFEDPAAWAKECRNLLRRDWDVVVLFTGPERVGKSSTAWKLCRAIDPNFTVDRVHFGLRNALGAAPDTPRYGAVLLDEVELNKRRGMHGPTLDFLDFLKDCGGLNLLIGICFPHVEAFDQAVLDLRVRYRVHVPERGSMILSERIRTERTNLDGSVSATFRWIERGRWQGIPENDGLEWDRYKAKKGAHMMRIGDRYKTAAPTPHHLDGWDPNITGAYFRDRPVTYE